MDKVQRRIEVAKSQAVRKRNYRRARDRALTRLSKDYPNVYRTYLEVNDMGENGVEVEDSAYWYQVLKYSATTF